MALPSATPAQTPTATLGLRVNIPPVCTASSLDYGVLDFGTHASLSNAIEATSSAGAGTIQINCISGMNYSVSLDGGLHGDGTQRYMQSAAGGMIAYQLFSDAQFNSPWNIDTPMDQEGTGSAQQIPLYGRVPVQATPSAGAYSDTVHVTVEW